MRTARRGSTASALAWAICLVGVLGFCGQSSAAAKPTGETSSSEPTSTPTYDDPFALDVPGSDLLAAERWGAQWPGDSVKVSWAFPESCEPTNEDVPNSKARSEVGEGGGAYWYLFQFVAPVPGSEVPAQRLDEAYQFVSSLEWEPA